MKLNIFWDLDGVIMKNKVEDYIGDDPEYAKAGYFENRPIDETAYGLFTASLKRKDINVYILSRGASNLPNKKQREQVISDKHKNLETVMPWFDKNNIIITDDDKVTAAVKYLGRDLLKTDILIDDFNENLKAWDLHGGTGIKYLNGINSSDSYDGIKIKGKDVIIPKDFDKKLIFVGLPDELADECKSYIERVKRNRDCYNKKFRRDE